MVADACAQLRLGRNAVEHIYNALRAKECAAGMAFCKRKTFSGDVEGDAHGLRKVYVSPSNPHMQTEVREALQRWKKNKKNKGKPEPKY